MLQERLIDTTRTTSKSGTWVVKAEWAHPHWNWYAVFLIDLTDELEDGPDPNLHMEDATHEIQVWALNPDMGDPDLSGQAPWGLRFLEPMNHAYQFRASTHEHALKRVRSVVKSIAEKKLSPDTDHARTWDRLFADGVSLRKSPEMPQLWLRLYIKE